MTYKITAIFILAVSICDAQDGKHILLKQMKNKFEADCDRVCQDLPIGDVYPVCAMYSRYKKGYQFFVNQCHARRAICKENIVLHMVHPSRCMKSNQFFKAIT